MGKKQNVITLKHHRDKKKLKKAHIDHAPMIEHLSTSSQKTENAKQPKSA